MVDKIYEYGDSIWRMELFGSDIYHLIAAFILYSMLGWLVESIYMSICNKKITNRGFAKGPFCPIYGFGAVIGYIILSPLAGHYVALYFAGAIIATVFEFLVGKLMIKVLGDLWWDYNEKPFNYKGIICLESTLAWGVYALIIIGFLNGKIVSAIDKTDPTLGKRACVLVLFMVMIDYLYRFYVIFKEKHAIAEEANKEAILETVEVKEN